MVAERSEYLRSDTGNKGNGYRLGHTYGQGRRLEFRIPCDRYGNFHPQILAILRSQEEECARRHPLTACAWSTTATGSRTSPTP